MPHRVLNLQEVSVYLHLPPADVEELVHNQAIPCERQGGRLMFRRKELDAWASQRILGFGEKSLKAYHRKTSAKMHDLSKQHALLPELLKLDGIEPALSCRTKPSVIKDMVALAGRTDLLLLPEDLHKSLKERERLGTTAMAGGLALLHPQYHDPYMFEDSFIVLARSIQQIPFGAPDGQLTDLFFLICCQDDRIHLHVLARLCMICYHSTAVLQLREAATAADMHDILTRAEQEVIREMG